ncbi:MAG: thioredoxin family protein [Calditrichaeota bacterium]|nr:MAG: thioredoxin family protein [Calditrichota bacterium]
MKIDKIQFDAIKNGLTEEQFQIHFDDKVNEIPAENVDPEAIEQHEYTKLNKQRSNRIDRTYEISREIRLALEAIDNPQTWLVITEAWCGDSAQNLPYIQKMAATNPNITLRLLLRDQNLEIMDKYLTNSTRSIPILVAFDEFGNELFRWGPRPKEAADLVKDLKSQGMEKPQFLEKLHLWYGRNRGKALEKELLHLIS